MQRIVPYLVGAVCLAAVAWAVSFGTLPKADFTFCNGDEIKTVDPALVTGQPEGRIVWALFEGLCRWDPRTLKPLPGMAERWEISDDKLRYTFFLRHDALWSDGSSVSAGDFVYSFRRFLHPATAAEYAFELWYVSGAQKFTTGKVDVGDPVEVELKEKPPGALAHAPGVMLYGQLVAIEGPEKAPVYTVEIDGCRRRFSQQPTAADQEPCEWVLYDFREVGIHAVDDYTLEIHLKHPVPYFLNLMGFYPMSPVNRRCVETHGFPAWTKPENIVCNGPFLLKFRRIRDRIRLVKNPTYWDHDNVRLDVIDALAVKSTTTMLNLYLTNQADWIPTVPIEVIPELQERPQHDFHSAPYLGNYYYLVNTKDPAMKDVRVRRALNLTMNKKDIVEKVARAGQVPARSMVPEKISEYIDYKPQFCGAYNPAAARKLLAEAGYPEGRGFPKIEILYNTSEAHQTIAELIQHQWKTELGIDVGLQNQEWSDYLAKRRQGEYQLARAGWIGDYVDPNTFLEMFTSASPMNQTGWANAEFDRLIELAQEEPDEARRLAFFGQAERILMDELPVIPIYYYVSAQMVKPYVRGFYPNIQDVHQLKWIWIDEEAKAEFRASAIDDRELTCFPTPSCKKEKWGRGKEGKHAQ